MEKINKRYEKTDFEKPDSVVSAYVCLQCGKLVTDGTHTSTRIKEYFAKGSIPSETCTGH